MRRVSFLLVLATMLRLAAAQDAAATDVREQKLAARAVAGFHATADGYTTQRQHAKALALRRELLTEYADGDEKALDKCGFSKVGDQWRADPQKLVIDKDFSGDAKALKKVEAEWAALQKELVAEHRAVAEAWTTLGDETKAMRHWRRVLRFAPADKRAVERLAKYRFEGFAGSEVELAMLRRARAIRGSCDWLLRKSFVVKKIDGRKQPLLEKAGIGHLGFRSEHFEIWGTLPEAQLLVVAQSAERALLLCHTLFGTSEGAPFVPARLRNFVFVAEDVSYGKVLDQCADQFDPERLAFLKKDVDLAYLDVDGASVRFCKTDGGEPEALDQTVRGVVQDAAGVWSEGLWEGIGHAACGFLFGRTLTFLLEQQSGRTVASGSQTLLVPDMAVWKQIAEQSAWAKSDTRTSELVLISAARFTNEQRVKSWAICDYLMHWRPELLRQLDLSHTKEIHSPPELEQEFQRRTQVVLPEVDHQWREFWGKNAALKKAMAIDPLGDPKGKERALREGSRSIVDAVNEQRAAARRGPVGFHFAEDAPTLQALAYGDDLAKAEAEAAKKPKVPVVMPTAPATIGRTLLWWRGAKPDDAVAKWLCRPSWRDTLLHPGRGLLGAQKGKQALVVDLSDPVQPTTQGWPLCWPRHHQQAVPGSAVAAELGPRALAALAAAGKQPTDVVGMPITLHFARAMAASDLAAVAVKVYQGNRAAHGVLVAYQGEGPDDDSADGCVAFVPLEPFEAGAEIEVLWTLPAKLLAKDQVFPELKFLVQ